MTQASQPQQQALPRIVGVDLETGEIVIDNVSESKGKRQRKTRQPDQVFEAVTRVCGYEGEPLTQSLRGAMNKAASEIRQVERERYAAVTADEIAQWIDDFGEWFNDYRREQFNEARSRAPYPMEMAKLWPMYRRAGNGRKVQNTEMRLTPEMQARLEMIHNDE